MKFLFQLLLIFSLSNYVQAEQHKTPFACNEVLAFCQRSIFEVTDERIHLREDRIGFFKDRFFILNDFDDWIPLIDLQRDHRGFFILMLNPKCPFGHPGTRRVKFTWFCFARSCPFFFHEHFGEGDFFHVK
ncbi:MAG TPA: hypothetical protein VLG76_06360 [Rhabdochlamydiaceae bacterium]|nr:hypothetical protein [Rhabdochlamydiaceae bacterium]